MSTLIIYPEAGQGGANTTTDGNVRNYWSGGRTWTIHVNAAGTTAYNTTSATLRIVEYVCDVTPNEWDILARAIFTLNGSAILGAVINSATFSFRGSSKSVGGTGSAPVTNIYSSAPADAASLVAGDYDSLGSTAFSTGIAYADYSIAGFNDWAFNVAGLAYLQTAIDGDGIIKIGARNHYDVTDTAPGWASSQIVRLTGYAADQAGTTLDPKITFDYTAAAGGGNKHEYYYH